MTYQVTGLASIHDLVGDRVVYRNLAPADPRLPGFAHIREELGLAARVPPRKAEPDYGRVVAALLRQAQELDRPGVPLRQLLYIGDTEMNDGSAFHNLCAAGPWSGWAFIGRDEMQHPLQVKIDAPLYLANRWSALPSFLSFVQNRGIVPGPGTAVVIDVDKTTIGAKGRNDRAIEDARLEGVRQTVADLLGPGFDKAAFRDAYDEFKQAPYHSFTADNQDYLAYICLLLGAGLFSLPVLAQEVRTGALPSFASLITRVEKRRAELARTGLVQLHEDFYRRFQAGDPTPFKAFRYNEYSATAARFGDLPGATVEKVLQERITITQEIKEIASFLRERGALLFCVSDKPDEASLPSEEQARLGMKPLHRLETTVVGERDVLALPHLTGG